MQKINQAVILAGGLGTRLRPLTLTKPKPMITIQGKPFLYYLLMQLKKNNIKRVVILVGYLHEEIENYFKDGSRFGLQITYSYLPVEANTGTRVKNVQRLVDDTFLLLYGDNFWPFDIDELIKSFSKNNVLCQVTAYRNRFGTTTNNMFINDRNMVELYDKSRKETKVNAVDIGFMIVKKEVLDIIPDENITFEESVFKKLIADRQLSAFLTDHRYYSLTSADRLPVVRKYFKKKKVVFLDRDGVINKKAPKATYITDWKSFQFLPQAIEAMKLLNEKGYKIFIISNQAGIARGMMTEKSVKKIHTKLKYVLKENGITISDIFFCPHGWDENCFCRKPSPGMFFQAATKHGINLYESYCIGDDERDMIAGKSVGSKTYLVNKMNLYTIVKKYL